MNRTIMGIKLRSAVGALVIGALALAACSSSSSSSSSPASSGSPAKVTLVVYSAQGYDKVMTAAFQKATGIPVKLDDNSTGPLLTQIQASKKQPELGTALGVAFRGRGYEHAVDLPGLGRLTGVFADTRAARGEAVGLRLEPGRCPVFAAPAGDAADQGLPAPAPAAGAASAGAAAAPDAEDAAPDAGTASLNRW